MEKRDFAKLSSAGVAEISLPFVRLAAARHARRLQRACAWPRADSSRRARAPPIRVLYSSLDPSNKQSRRRKIWRHFCSQLALHRHHLRDYILVISAVGNISHLRTSLRLYSISLLLYHPVPHPFGFAYIEAVGQDPGVYSYFGIGKNASYFLDSGRHHSSPPYLSLDLFTVPKSVSARTKFFITYRKFYRNNSRRRRYRAPHSIYRYAYTRRSHRVNCI